MPVVNPKVGKMRTMIQRYQKLLIMIEWFSSDLKNHQIKFHCLMRLITCTSGRATYLNMQQGQALEQ